MCLYHTYVKEYKWGLCVFDANISFFFSVVTHVLCRMIFNNLCYSGV